MDLNQYNPYPSFQLGQAEAIGQMLELIEDGQKVVELNAPTAAGKSLDLYVLGKILFKEYNMDKVIYTTPLVALVTQLQKNELFNEGELFLNELCNLKNYIKFKFIIIDNNAIQYCDHLIIRFIYDAEFYIFK